MGVDSVAPEKLGKGAGCKWEGEMGGKKRVEEWLMCVCVCVCVCVCHPRGVIAINVVEYESSGSSSIPLVVINTI